MRVGDRVNMLEHSVYSVITPEGCASILWRDAGRAEEAATAMRITAPDLKALGIIDEIVPAPPGGAHALTARGITDERAPAPRGGAHADPEAMFRTVDLVLAAQLRELCG